jgi:hypothetical protein
MTELSPQAQAVLDAFIKAPCSNELSVAAAIRAAADQVASPIPDDCTPDVFNRQLEIRGELLAIAAELEKQ